MAKHTCEISGITFVTRDGWININNNLPDRDGRYLVTAGNNPENCIQISSFKNGKFDISVSHWQPMPNPPVE